MTPPTISLELADGHVLGNFHAYYSFNPAHERLRFMDARTRDALSRALLTSDWEEDMEPATIMDVGCNEGDLTIGLFKHLIGDPGNAITPSVDVVSFNGSDVSTLNELVQKNKQKIEYAFTEEGSSEHRRHFMCELRIDDEPVARSEGVSKKVAKAKAATEALQHLTQNGTSDATVPTIREPTIPTATTQPVQLSQRRRLCVLGVDVDEDLIERATKKAISSDPKHSDTVIFAHANVMERSMSSVVENFLTQIGCKQQDEHTSSARPKRRPFTLVTLFSVTMWIHLNHGDDGLWKFLGAVVDMADHLIVEPQPWKCYRNAINRLSRYRATIPPSFSSLKVREDIVERIDRFLLDAGRFHCKAELGKTNWSRPIRLYSRKPIPGIEYVPR